MFFHAIPVVAITNLFINIFSTETIEHTGGIIGNINILSKTLIATVENKEHIHFGKVFFSVVILGCIVLCFINLIKYVRTLKIMKRWNKQDVSERERKIFEEGIKEFKIKSNLELVENELIPSPMAVGIIKKVIILPSVVRTKNENTIRNYIYHELVHIKKKDNEIGFLMRIIEIANWYNPIIHILIKAQKNYCEFTCDENVLKNREVDFRNEYVNTIIDTVKWQMKTQIFFGKSFSNARITKQRIDSIVNKKVRKKGTCFLVIIITFTITLSGYLLKYYSLEDSVIYKNCINIIQLEDTNSSDYYNSIINQLLMELNKNTFLKYEKYGITIDKNTGRLYYNNNLVRNFEDKRIQTKTVLYYEDGDIDLYIKRNVFGGFSEIQQRTVE